MKLCLYCKEELPDHARFCGKCGAFQGDSGNSAASGEREASTQYGDQGLAGLPGAQGYPPFTLSGGMTPPGGVMMGSGGATPPVMTPGGTMMAAGGATPPVMTPGGVMMGSGGATPPVMVPGGTVAATGGGAWPPQRPAEPQRRSLLASTPARIILVVVILVVLAAGGFGGYQLYLLSRPKPIIQVSSSYHVGLTPAGSVGTSLQVSGQNFASNSTVIFLLDGHTLAGVATQSDSQGKITANLSITQSWPLGVHTLTASDASNNVTQRGVKVQIVQQGEANTPGPNGAPADDASFQINASLQGKFLDTGNPFTERLQLMVTGHPDPQGGSVCEPEANGQPTTYQGDTNDNPPLHYQETLARTCQGSYKGGHLTYTETATQDKLVLTNSQGQQVTTCQAETPYTWLQLDGTFKSQSTIEGSFNAPSVSYTCDKAGLTYGTGALQGSWMGNLAS